MEQQNPIEENVVALIHDRLEMWNVTINAQLVYLSEYLDHCKNSVSTFSRMAAILSAALPKPGRSRSSSSSSSSSSIRNGSVESVDEANLTKRDGESVWLGPLQAHAMRNARSEQVFFEYLKESTRPALEAAQLALKEKSGNIRSLLEEALQKLSKKHESLMAATNQHERNWAVRLDAHLLKDESSNGNSFLLSRNVEDVWISEQTLRTRVLLFLEEKRSFCKVLKDTLDLLRQLDVFMTETVRPVFKEMLTVRAKNDQSQSEFVLAECVGVLESVNVHNQWLGLLDKHQLSMASCLVEAPPLDGLFQAVLTQVSQHVSAIRPIAPLTASIGIARAGFLMRPGTFGRGWNVYFCVLTSTAFLHCYRTSGNEETSDGRSCRVPSSSMNLHSKALKDLNKAAVDVWIPRTDESMAICFDGFKKLASPSTSISLLHPDTIVSHHSESAKAMEHVISITIPNSGGFLGRSEKRMLFRSFVEDDMVDWVIALKTAISTGATSCCSLNKRRPLDAKERSLDVKESAEMMSALAIQTPSDDEQTLSSPFGSSHDAIDVDDEYDRGSVVNGALSLQEEANNPWN